MVKPEKFDYLIWTDAHNTAIFLFKFNLTLNFANHFPLALSIR